MFRRTFLGSLFSLPFVSSFGFEKVEKKEKYHAIVDWAEKNFYIRGTPIKLYSYQKRILTDWMVSKEYIKVHVGCRQSGKTTLSAIHARYMCEHNNDFKYAIFTTSHNMCKHIMHMIKDSMISADINSRNNRKNVLRIRSFDTIEYYNASKILVCPYTPVATCGYRLDCVHFDEMDAAHPDKTEELWKCIIPVLLSHSATKNSKIIASSSFVTTTNTRFKHLIKYSKPIYTTWHDVPHLLSRTADIKNAIGDAYFNLEYENRLT